MANVDGLERLKKIIVGAVIKHGVSKTLKQSRYAMENNIPVGGKIVAPLTFEQALQQLHIVPLEAGMQRLKCIRESSVKRKSKEDPPVDPLSTCGQEERYNLFFVFVLEALRGQQSEDPAIAAHALGGAAILLPDALSIATTIHLKHSSLSEQLWRCVVCIWLGSGGPRLSTYNIVVRNGLLPNLDRNSDLKPMYDHLHDLVRQHGRGSVLAGDGTAVKMRFEEVGPNRQGISVLVAWRNAVANLIDLLSEGAEGRAGTDLDAHRRARLRGMGAAAIVKHFEGIVLEECTDSGKPRSGYFKDLAIKELFTYMAVVDPAAFDPDAVPFGLGAIRGCGFFWNFGLMPSQLVARQLTSQLVAETPSILKAIVQAKVRSLPKHIQDLQGFQHQISNPFTVLDAEVCFCWFQSWLTTRPEQNAPTSWHGFARSQWD